MDLVRGYPFFIYHEEFVFCSSASKTVYKDRVNNKEIVLYEHSNFNSQTTLIGLAWQQLKPGVRLLIIITSYKNKIILIFRTIVYDIRTKLTKYLRESFTTISVPPRSMYLYTVSYKPLSFEHKINKYSDRYQGVIYLTTN